MLQVKVKRLEPDIELPRYAYEGDAGMDVSSRIDYVLEPKTRYTIPTGLCFAIPHGYEMQVRARSGLAARHGISVLNSPGTIDHGYRGELGVILINHGTEQFDIRKGQRIAQVVFNKIELAELVETDELPPSTRGEGGFGSTGT